MTTTKTLRRPLAVLKLPKAVSTLITYAQAIVKAMTGNPTFPTPSPTLVVVTAAITDLYVAETAALARTKGAVTTRNEKRLALIKLLQQLLGYIQTTADANVENETSTIESAGVSVRKFAAHTARTFSAKQGAVSGSARVTAVTAARRASYEWEYSTDAGKTWVLAPVTLQAKTTISGLTPGATVLFRFRPVTKAGEGDWSQPVALIVR